MSNRYVRVDRGSGSRAGQLQRHHEDPNRWLVRVYIGRSNKGRAQYVSKVVHGRRRDAEAQLIELLQDKNQGTLTPRSSATVADLTKEWLAHKAHEVSARTLKGYETTLDTYVLPTLGHRRLKDLTLREIQSLYATLRNGDPRQGREDGGWSGEPLSARTVQMAHTALNQALKTAVTWGMIPFNPAQEASVKSAPSKTKRALSVAERTAFLDAAITSEAFYRTLYRVLMDTGLRPGEACALTWRDLDFQAGRITVSKTITKGANAAPVIAPPKTAKSSRTLPMFALQDDLLEHYKWQAEVGLDDSGHVFTNQEGGLLTPWTFNKRELDRVATTAGIQDGITLYSFRHTFATLHLASGTPLKVVSAWLGHSTIRQTADTYMHMSNEVAEDYAERHVAWLEAASRATEPSPVN